MTGSCRECGTNLGAGYLCDDCDEITFADEPDGDDDG